MRTKKELVSQRLSQIANLEAEQTLLGILILDQEGEAREDIFSKLCAKDFYDENHKIIFQIINAMFLKGLDIDFVSVSDCLSRQLDLKTSADFFEEMIACTNSVISISNYNHFLSIVKDYSNLRQIENICYLGQDLVKSGKRADAVTGIIQAEFEKLENQTIQSECEQISDAVDDAFERIKKRANGEHDEFGLRTGFPCLDKCLWGLQKSDMVIVAARAGVGKTAFALNVIDRVAVKDKKKVAFFSLEMPKRQIIERLISLGTDIPNFKLKSGQMENKFKLVEKYKDELKSSQLFMDDDSTNTVQKMLLKAKRMQRRVGLDLVVIDYLQFIKPQEKSGNRFQDVGEIARTLKSMARELNVPVLVLCQLNRQLDNEQREPTLADLRESGEIENNADIVMFLNSKSGKVDEIKKLDLIIGKFRNGALKKIGMTYKGECFKFSEIEKEKETFKQQELIEIEDIGLPF